MESIKNLETIKYGKGEEYYVYRFGLFFSGGVKEIEDDYGFKFLISKDLTTAFVVNDKGNFKVITVDEAISGINSVKLLSEITSEVYGNEVLNELIVEPPLDMSGEGLN